MRHRMLTVSLCTALLMTPTVAFAIIDTQPSRYGHPTVPLSAPMTGPDVLGALISIPLWIGLVMIAYSALRRLVDE